MAQRLALACALLAACTSRTLETPDTSFAVAYATALCTHQVACGLDARFLADCEALVIARYLPLPPDPATGLADGTYTFDAASAAACIYTVGSGACEAGLARACQSVVRGVLTDGAACTWSSQCASGSCNCATGTCVERGGIGDDCDDGCPDDAYCDRTRHCAARLPAGAICSVGECMSGLVCLGTCKPPGAVGDVCLEGDLAVESTGTCAAGLACDESLATPVCEPLHPIGARCGAVDACVAGASCIGLVVRKPGAPFEAGTCEPALTLGSACVASELSDPCPLFTRCEGTCTALPELGEPCTDACAVGWCDGVCRAFIGEGEPCDPALGDVQCAIGSAGDRRVCDGATCHAARACRASD